ncbi:hypothetical protein BH747_07765 [Enterococcus villorum]|uniref:Uncharacterized protein n=1 Tax=Enterococcus villorum TaxID=112904 RepID=A0A1V8YBR4_9ENTE|nr:hypothetical protein [Enterococcus villorum]OQO70053.1 hypothetical protein BH747_07765 [Enterococcus villorum]OQO71857.1 hypothetical protein BH744_13070 [Enterococcus villorum]
MDKRKRELRRNLVMLTNKDDWSKDQSVFLQVREIIAKIEGRNTDREKDIEDFNSLNQLKEKKK